MTTTVHAPGRVLTDAGRRPRDRRARRHRWSGFLFVGPAIAILAVMVALPAAMTLGFSFTDVSFLRPAHYTGLGNYRSLLHDVVFRQSVLNTLYYTVGVTVPTLVLGLLAALAVNRKFRGRTVVRVLFYLPVLTSVAAAAVVWLFLYDPVVGPVNGILSRLGIGQPQWLESPHTALPALIVMAVWREFGTAMILYLAGLQGLPADLDEAAGLDGAGPLRTLLHVKLPLLRPTTYYLAVITIVGSFQVFGAIYIMTQGGPVGATTTVVYDIYQSAFSYAEFGYASAMSVVLFLVILIASLFGGRFLRKAA